MADALGPLNGILGLHLRLAHGAVQRHFGAHFAALALTQKQVSVLWLTADAPGIAQTEIARRLQMDRATTMSIVHGLERRGLLVRSRVAGDARRVALAPTLAGQAALADARDAIDRQEAWLHGRFTATEAALLLTLLRRIHSGGDDDR